MRASCQKPFTSVMLYFCTRENKLLSNEIKDIMDQISEGGRSIHEIDKVRPDCIFSHIQLLTRNVTF